MKELLLKLNTHKVPGLDGITSTVLKESAKYHLKAELHLKAVLFLGIMVLTQISRSRFEQSKISAHLMFTFRAFL